MTSRETSYELVVIATTSYDVLGRSALSGAYSGSLPDITTFAS